MFCCSAAYCITEKGKDKIEAHIIRCKSVIAICLIQNLALSMIIIIDMSHGEI